mmetsp:Transcript_18567/g.33547  ORF Transcript_18567/g.33547 Transcript_18567/m.33547 type:complete len:82 (+) Transcript_18567:656-901(+)
MDEQQQEMLSSLTCAQAKKGLPLNTIAQNLNLPEDDVVDLIAWRTRLQSRIVKGVLTSIASGLTIDEMPSLFFKKAEEIRA